MAGYIPRDVYLQKLIDSRLSGDVKVVTGSRRCGKSWLLTRLYKDYLIADGVPEEDIIIVSLDMDDENNQSELADKEKLKAYLYGKITDPKRTYYVMLDEIQEVDGFEKLVNGLRNKDNVDVYVTGSNARFLSKDIVTEFRGRGLQIHISPLSFAELMTFYNGSKEDALEHYLRYGGLPQVALQPNDEYRSTVLKDLLKETYIIDILERNRVKNSAELEELLAMLASGIGGLTNPQKLSNTFKTVKNVSIGAPTLKSYIDYFCDAFLVEQVNRYDVKGKRYISTPLKYYFSDLGLRNALLNFRQVEKTHLMENLIYNELRSRGYNVDVGVVPYNGKNAQGVSFRTQLDVDFVCNKGSQRLYVQSALALPTQEKIDQETKSLRRIDDGFQKMVVVGDHTIGSHDENGILFINIYDFLMQ